MIGSINSALASSQVRPMDKPKRPWRTVALLLAIYLSSLFFPGIYANDPHSSSTFMTGLSILASGWLGVLSGNFGWLANPAFFACLLTLWLRYFLSTICLAALAIAFALDSLRIDEVWYTEATSTPVLGLGIGYAIWLASFLAAVVIGAFHWYRANNSFKPKPLRGSV